MNDLELGWLVPTMLQVLGLSIALGILGFAYDGAMRERKALVEALEAGNNTWWLGVAGVLFAGGMLFTKAGWGMKVVTLALVGVLVGLSWSVPGRTRVEVERKVYRGSKKRPVWQWIVGSVVGLAVLGVLAWGAHLGYHAAQLLVLAKQAQGAVSQMQAEEGIALIEDAAEHIGAIRQDMGPLVPIFNGLSGVPKAGAYLGQIDLLLEYADGLAQAGKEIALGLEPLLAEGDEQTPLTERASRVIEAGQGHFAAAAQAVERASEVRGLIRPEVLPEKVRAMYMQLDERFELLQAGVKLLQVAPKLLGTEEAQNYLVLAQNRDELRATGGFISGIGLLTLDNGRIVQLSLGDSYQIDDYSKGYPQPPEPLHRFMLADYWVTRDANWSPDFPTSAKKVQELYTLSTGVETQGVVAFNQLAVRQVLDVIGPVQVPGTEEAVTAENVEEYMRQAWAPEPGEGISSEWWMHRKDFMQQLGNVILNEALKSGDRQQLLELAKIILEMLTQGHVQIYFNDSAAQEALKLGSWDHGLKAGSGDFIYLIDSNIGFNKVDSVIKRSVVYKVDLRDIKNPKSEVTTRYQHTGSGNPICKQESSYGNGTYQDMVERCYIDYWRIYVPTGAELLSSNARSVPGVQLLSGEEWSGQVETLDEEGVVEVFAGLLMLPVGESVDVKIAYSQSPNIVQPVGSNIMEYNLCVAPQAGLDGLPFRLEVTLPGNTVLVEAGEGWRQVDAQSWAWNGILTDPRNLTLKIQINKP